MVGSVTKEVGLSTYAPSKPRVRLLKKTLCLVIPFQIIQLNSGIAARDVNL